MGKTNLSIVSFVLLVTTSIAAWGTVPPLTVNQNIGIPDTQFNNQPAEVCKECHDPYAGRQTLIAVPYQDGYLADRHHQHVGTEIAGGLEQPPYRDSDGDGIDDTIYSCANCHYTCDTPDPYMGCLPVVIELDCLDCHVVENGERTVHHDTPSAKEAQCADCHGSVVESLDAGRAPPMWHPTTITPWISNKPNGDPTITSPAGTHPGNCDFCHNAADVTIEMVGAIKVFSNEDTHHGTGLPSITDSSKGSPCFWCHPEDVNFPEDELIRICERCHDIPSLHSIQYDAEGDGILPGLELPYQGHIGNGDDCWGCHGFDESGATMSLSMPMTPVAEATIPQLYDISARTWGKGAELEMTLSGNGFINQGGLENEITYRPTVLLTDSNGISTELQPIAESVNTVQVIIPAMLAAGNYDVQVKKEDHLSNPIGATVTPTINVLPGAAACLSEYKVVILRGNGFENAPDFKYSPSLTGDGVLPDRIFLWRDGLIAARFNAGCPTTVQIRNVFDSATVTPVIW